MCGDLVAEVDHVIPRSCFGADGIANYQYLCELHHKEKTALDHQRKIEDPNPYMSRFNEETWEQQRDMDSKCGYGGDGTFHRSESVNIDLFKNWDERFAQCRDRFSTVSATGGTPLCDGIQYAMQELSDRTEVHRVIIVLTDGAANSPKVVNRQIRLAKEAGITVIGVGIGSYCGIVETQFPANHIQIPDVKELPKKLLGMLESIMFPKRAKRAKMDGRIG